MQGNCAYGYWFLTLGFRIARLAGGLPSGHILSGLSRTPGEFYLQGAQVCICRLAEVFNLQNTKRLVPQIAKKTNVYLYLGRTEYKGKLGMARSCVLIRVLFLCEANL